MILSDELKDIVSKAEAEMSKCIEFFDIKLGEVKTGKVSSSMISRISVNAYDVTTPVLQLCSVSTKNSGRSMTLTVFDSNLTGTIKKAIVSADLGLDVSSNENSIFLQSHPITQESKKSYINMASKVSENAKAKIRNIRRDFSDKAKKLKNVNSISEDNVKDCLKSIDKITNGFVDQILNLFTQKEKAILEE